MLFYANVTLHVLAALVWLGGMFFLALVGAPVLRSVEPPQLRAEMFRRIGHQFRAVGWTAILILLITGLGNLYFRGFLQADVLFSGAFWTTRYGHSLAAKLGIVFLMLTFQAIHDFRHGPRSSTLRADSAKAAKMRKWASWLARINVILGVVLVYYAVRLARGG